MVPKHFHNLIAPNEGNIAQKAVKYYIEPYNPEGTIALMEKMQVDKFQKVLKALVSFAVDCTIGKNRARKVQTNYVLKNGSLSSLVDFAITKTTFNEGVHTGLLFYNLATIPQYFSPDRPLSVLLGTAGSVVTIYCALAQRYSRAKLALVIDKRYEKGKKINKYEYMNPLNANLSYHKSDD